MTFDHAREYLARALPWPQEGEPPAYVNIHWTFQSNNHDRPGWGGRACKNLTEAVKAIEFALKGDSTRDIYVCLSTQSKAEAVQTPKGWTYYKPIRLQTNAVALKSLFIDIDCKDGPNGYQDQKSATTALVEFLKDSGMPRPTMIVASGGGMHVYWTMSEAVSPARWKPLALALAEATKQHGLKCDTQCTIDSARILRVPDTFNRKTDTPRPVKLAGSRLDFDYSVERMEEVLKPFATSAAPEITLPPRAVTTPVVDELSANIESNRAPPVPVARIADQCGFIREALTTGGKDFANPLWNLTTLIATFTEEGRDAAHQMADQHPGYTQESTDALYDRKERDKEEKGLGWPGCRTISGTGCVSCATCVHFSAGKTPLHFALPQVVAPVVATKPDGWDLPAGYIRDDDNKVLKVVMQQDGSQDVVPIMSYPMFDPWLQKNPWVLNFTTVSHRGHEQQIAMPFSETLVSGGVRAVLGKQGLAVRGGRSTQLLEDFFVSWIEKLQTMKDSVVASAPFGWMVRNGKTEGFIYGSQLWTPTGNTPSAVGDPVIAASYMPCGDPDAWREACDLVTSQGRPALDAIIASSFGAPLVRFTGQSGLMMSAYSSASGIGKTTAMKVAQAVWGDPIKAMQGLDDTPLSVLNKIGHIKALPLYWDEMKTEDDTKKFVNLMFSLTRGRERSRMASDVSQRVAGSWQTMLVSASNESIIDYVVNRTKTSSAGIMRTFEYEVPLADTDAGQIETGDADQILGRLNDNYGHIGLDYAKWLGQNFVQVEIDVAECRKQIAIETNAVNEERFWTAAIAVVLMGAKYANELGYTKIDEERLKAFLIETLQGMRGTVKDQPNDMTNSTNVDNVLAQYLGAMRARHTLWANYIPISRGRPPKEIKVLRDTSKLEDINVHIGVENKILRINSTQFSDWCKEKGYSRTIVVRCLEKEYGCKRVNGRMASGTQFAGILNEYMLEIQLAGTPFAAVLDGEEE